MLIRPHTKWLFDQSGLVNYINIYTVRLRDHLVKTVPYELTRKTFLLYFQFRVALVRENYILFKVREKSESFVSGQGLSKSLFKVSEKSGNFTLRLPQIILLDVFMKTRQFCFKNYVSHSYFCWFMARIIVLHGQWRLLHVSQGKVRDFFWFWWVAALQLNRQ